MSRQKKNGESKSLKLAMAAVTLGMSMGVSMGDVLAADQMRVDGKRTIREVERLKEQGSVELPAFQQPEVAYPKVERPGVSYPKVEQPGVKYPKIERPGTTMHKLERPGTAIPKLERPKP